MISCLSPESHKEERFYEKNGSIKKKVYFLPNITYDSFVNCDRVWRSLEFVFPFSHHFQKKSDTSVAFQMIGDNYSDTKKQVCYKNCNITK